MTHPSMKWGVNYTLSRAVTKLPLLSYPPGIYGLGYSINGLWGWIPHVFLRPHKISFLGPNHLVCNEQCDKYNTVVQFFRLKLKWGQKVGLIGSGSTREKTPWTFRSGSSWPMVWIRTWQVIFITIHLKSYSRNWKYVVNTPGIFPLCIGEINSGLLGKRWMF